MMYENTEILLVKLYLTRFVMEIAQPGATMYIFIFSDQQFVRIKYFLSDLSGPYFDNCCVQLASQRNTFIECCRVSKFMPMKTILSESSRLLREPLKMLTGS